MNTQEIACKLIESAIVSFDRGDYAHALLSAGQAEEVLEGVLHAGRRPTQLDNWKRSFPRLCEILHEGRTSSAEVENRAKEPLRRLREDPDHVDARTQEDAKDFISRSIDDYYSVTADETDVMWSFREKHLGPHLNAQIDGADFPL